MTKPDPIPFWERERGGGPVTDALESRERLRRKFLAEIPTELLAIRIAGALRDGDTEAAFVLSEECERRGIKPDALRKATLLNSGMGEPCLECSRSAPKHWHWCSELAVDSEWEA